MGDVLVTGQNVSRIQDESSRLLNTMTLSVGTRLGPYDILALVEADDLNAIGTVVMQFIHEVGGVENTITCPVIDT